VLKLRLWGVLLAEALIVAGVVPRLHPRKLPVVPARPAPLARSGAGAAGERRT
jgi:hypothetical protein